MGDGDSGFETMEREGQWIRALYTDLLERQPDAQGYAYWLERRTSGAGLEEVAMGFLRSVEFARMTVASLYATFLGRTPDEQGLRYWSDHLVQGMSLQDAVRGFCESAEYHAKVPDPGEFVESLFGRLLGRSSDPAGKAYWVGMLAAHQGAAYVIDGFLTSVEFANQRVTDMYRTFLGRQPDHEGLVYWVGHLTSRQALQEVQCGFLTSREYRDRASRRFEG